MARKSTNDDPKTVVLVHPDGSEYRSNSPAEINRLHYGQGYTFRDVPGFTEAIEYLGEEAAVMGLRHQEAPSGAVTLDDAGSGADGAPSD